MKHALILFVILFAGLAWCKQPVELGTVKWSRDLAATLEATGKSGKPVFLLFQEVPG